MAYSAGMEGGITWLRWVLGTTLAVIVVSLSLWVGIQFFRRADASGAPDQPPDFDQVRLGGVSSKILDDEQRLLTITVDSLVHRKRRLGPLTINPIKEIAISGVRLEIESPPRVPGVFGEGRFLTTLRKGIGELLSRHDLGFVSRIVIHELDIVGLREGRQVFAFHAGRLVMGVGDQAVSLEQGITVQTPSGERLDAWSGRWEPREQRLVVTKSFLHRRKGKTVRGAEASFRFDRTGEIHQD